MMPELHILGLEQLGHLARRPRAITIGNFDGVHRGHQSLLSLLPREVEGAPVQRCVLTFHPHPAALVAPERRPKVLSTLEERLSLLARYGAEEVVVLRFTEAVAELTAEQFARQVLSQSLDARQVVVGGNFRFGHQQQGNAELLRTMGDKLGFGVTIAPLLHIRKMAVSSSMVRRLLMRGEAGKAARLLGRPFALAGPVVPGRGVGGKQTVPTLNLADSGRLLPADGVYVTRTTDTRSGITYPSITNVGLRPTFTDGHPERTVETFLLGPLLQQPEWISVEFLRWVRAEQRFESPEQLKQQIFRDVGVAQHFHRRLLRFQPDLLRLGAAPAA